MTLPVDATDSEYSNPPPEKRIRSYVRNGLLVVAVLFLGIGGWAFVTPLDSAAVATGEVAVESTRKTVNHFEGGIVKDILVSEGDYVEEGMVLIRLDDINANATLSLLRSRFDAADALMSRLIAERDDLDEIPYSENLINRLDEEKVNTMVMAQDRLFRERRASMQGETIILNQQVSQMEEQIQGFNAEIEATQRQIILIREEIAAVNELVEKGLERRPRLLALQRREAELAGTAGRLRSQIAATKQSIGEAKQRKIQLMTEFRRDVVTQLRETQDQIFELDERLRASQDVLDRIEIRAPQSGYVVGQTVHTVGSAVRAGDRLLDIVPNQDDLIVLTRLSPTDIDVVRPGLESAIRLTAFSTRNTPLITGIVETVSADRLVDPQTGAPFYEARIKVDQEELSLYPELELYPGMPADVMIKVGQRKVIEYFVDPILKSLETAFTEQ